MLRWEFQSCWVWTEKGMLTEIHKEISAKSTYVLRDFVCSISKQNEKSWRDVVFSENLILKAKNVPDV